MLVYTRMEKQDAIKIIRETIGEALLMERPELSDITDWDQLSNQILESLIVAGIKPPTKLITIPPKNGESFGQHILSYGWENL